MKTLIEHFDMKPPPIAAVDAGVDRPLWSVMIPTYNCAKYLRYTLESVLAQDPGPEVMQIEVIDDGSMQDDPEAVVRELGKGRVGFYRKPKNEGAVANFNTCIERSKGHLVHILHGDDWVAHGYYKRITAAEKEYPGASLLASRVFFVEEDGVITGVSARFPKHEKQPSQVVNSFWNGSPLQFSGVTVRRDFYEKFGGYRPELVHTADWEMWVRATGNGSSIILPEILGFYRIFSGNDTGRLMRTGENLLDMERLGLIFEKSYPDFPVKKFNRSIIDKSWFQAMSFKGLLDEKAYLVNYGYWKSHASLKQKIKQKIINTKKMLVKIIFHSNE